MSSSRAAAVFAMLRAWGAAAGDDAVLDLLWPGAGGLVPDGLAQRPAQYPRALLGDMPAGTLASDSRWREVGLAQQLSCPGLRNRVMSPISATMTVASTGPMPDRGVSLTPGQHRIQQGDLDGELLCQLPQRGDLTRVRLRELQLLRPRLPVHADKVRAGDRDAELGQHRVHLVLDRGARLDQLVPVPG